MATYNDPVRCFAPLEVIERLLGIRNELGFAECVYLPSSDELADSLDAYGFSVYSYVSEAKVIDFGHYSTPLVPGGEIDSESVTAH